MKKILIVDDEYIVRLGLRTIVDWVSFGYTVAGEAANGKEAFDFFEKNPVDVIVTDIKMPVMDGLELIRKVRARNKKTRILILSHYDEFSYAQEAITLGAFQYILKSELTKTNLEQVLKSLHLDSDNSPGLEQKAGWKENLEGFIREQMLPSFSRQFKDEKGETGQRRIPFPSSAAPPAKTGDWAVFSVSCRTTSLLSDALEKFPKTITVLFEEAFENLVGTGQYEGDDFHFAALAPVENPVEAEGGSPAEKITSPSWRIVKNVRQYYDVNLFIGVSSWGKIEDWDRLLREAHQARFDCFFSQKLFVGMFSGKPGDRRGFKKSGLVSYTKLVDLMDTHQKDAMLDYIHTIFRELQVGGNYAAVYSAFIDFSSVGKLIHEKYQLEEEASLSEHKFKHDAFFDLPFIGDAEIYIYELFLALLSAKQNGRPGYSQIVKKSIDFIQSDYMHNIGLTDAAEYAAVSHSYLSFIFKQETGINFNTALAQYRIEQAKKLLAATNLKIYQVAEKVGFSNPYYFSKLFREISGYTCKEYRNRSGE